MSEITVTPLGKFNVGIPLVIYTYIYIVAVQLIYINYSFFILIVKVRVKMWAGAVSLYLWVGRILCSTVECIWDTRMKWVQFDAWRSNNKLYCKYLYKIKTLISLWQRRFPDFSYINNGASLDEFVDCVIISHFHLDHCGALPYMSEMIGYNGPIYMTHPTKAICPILLVSTHLNEIIHIRLLNIKSSIQ